MNPAQAIQAAQDLARRFNDDGMVCSAFERRRLFRKFLRKRNPLPEECLDRADWLAAEREARPVGAIGFTISQPATSNPPSVQRNSRLEARLSRQPGWLFSM